jgi:hypothetical protein
LISAGYQATVAQLEQIKNRLEKSEEAQIRKRAFKGPILQLLKTSLFLEIKPPLTVLSELLRR